METFLTIISFPFWFFGVMALGASLFGNITVGRQTNTFEARLIGIIFGIACLFIAWIMI